MNRARSRELGIITGTLPTGQWNAITDVAGVLVGYSTLNRDTPSIAHTGVTAIWPRSAIYRDSVFAGVHSFNGYGEMTGTLWIDEQGLVSAPICITNTYSVGTVRDAVCEHAITHSKSAERSLEQPLVVHLPVVAETWDGFISDIDSMPVTKAMAFEALSSAASGPIAEGNVGGGTGMVCHEFKGGTGTASRVTPRGYTWGPGADELRCARIAVRRRCASGPRTGRRCCPIPGTGGGRFRLNHCCAGNRCPVAPHSMSALSQTCNRWLSQSGGHRRKFKR